MSTPERSNQEFSREQFDGVLRSRFFYAPSFEIYGGVSGLYDYGPAGCSLQNNIIAAWKRHFIIEEDMLEVDCTVLTPYEVLKTSGHVDKFADWMCRDLATGEIFRADHLVEEVLESRIKGDKIARGLDHASPEESDDKKKRKKKVKEIHAVKLDPDVATEYEQILAKIDGYSGAELGELIIKHNITNPASGGKLEPPVEFNLMFETLIGPSGQYRAFLRPETAQGHFINFSKLLDANNGKMPFASASVGKSYRNEISPRAGLLRVREFLMAEIEHYVDPAEKSHPRFSEIKSVKIQALPRDVQLRGSAECISVTIGDAVASGMIENETLGYFIARISLFLLKIGVDPKRMRFRQHMDNEMAHYATDCWDCELQSSYGWIECVGCADRSAYDLSVHSARTSQKLVVRETHMEPIVVERFEVEFNLKQFGPRFRKDAGKIRQWLETRNQCELEKLSAELGVDGKVTVNVDNVGCVEIDSSLIKIEKRTIKEYIREFTPNVIEPSFGIGRVLYSLLEHCWWTRPEDSSRGVLSFPPAIAPTKVLLVPLQSNKKFDEIVAQLTRLLRKDGVSCKVDDSSASIGKRYARNDEMGTPLGITVDFQTLEDATVTIRERDTTEQKRGSIPDVIRAVKAIVFDDKSWDAGTEHLKPFTGQE